ncbi:hypothetical protein [Xanthomonas vesicatoria]|uniref:hypothetical protein n=1 Tax=Xanthomonas vesicatoria TaxID=56460 RepID=UPI000731F570|nr:hypothetical protein [Xanthomonas vesicatoria]MCC8556628.1 hypothetical protein [Xanthomonas vesicatoria]MCC8599673.1 hypothetical protein [Xanthomonas vesicatoria]MCC8609674.1 hypothetical protein [Xanthomonas vesicatoria]MCC8618381.1 hypothetical protein [Xanthomonas vesicatoria]MCC8631278.1 hypothetical protein [Xanthomonas vesicatoria]
MSTPMFMPGGTHAFGVAPSLASARRRHGYLLVLAAQAGLILQSQASAPSAGTVSQVLDQLRREIAAEPATNPVPIETVLQRHADTTGLSFDMSRLDDTDDTEATPAVPPPGVTEAEWSALQAYRATSASAENDIAENGYHHYMLVDLDDDGQRDLIDDAYVGGTGLFNTISVLHFDRTQGFLPLAANAVDADGTPGSFSINGRGGDQALYWLRIDGKSYAAYRDGDYFQDTVTVSRPLPSPGEPVDTQVLQVRYRYQHTLAPPSHDAASATPEEQQASNWLAQHPQLQAAMDRQLQQLAFAPDGTQRAPDPAARCPVQTSGDPDEADQWPWHGAGHYSFDYVADLRVRHGQACYSASIVFFRSSFLTAPDGCCALWLFDAPGNQVTTLPLRSRRERSGVALVAAVARPE